MADEVSSNDTAQSSDNSSVDNGSTGNSQDVGSQDNGSSDDSGGQLIKASMTGNRASHFSDSADMHRTSGDGGATSSSGNAESV